MKKYYSVHLTFREEAPDAININTDHGYYYAESEKEAIALGLSETNRNLNDLRNSKAYVLPDWVCPANSNFDAALSDNGLFIQASTLKQHPDFLKDIKEVFSKYLFNLDFSRFEKEIQ